MALTYSVTGASIINQADSVTDWDAVRWTGTGGAPSAALDTTVFFETTGSIAAKLNGNNWKAGLAFDWYSDQSNTVQDLTVSGSEMLGMMVLMTTESVALTRANGGFFFWVSSDTTTGTTAPTQYSEWWVGGSDEGTSGWRQYWVDTRKAPSFTAGGGSTVTITSSSATTNEILTASAHGLFTGQTVTIASHTGSTPSINRADYEVRVTDSTHFIIVDDDGTDLDITTGGTGGTVALDGADLTAIRRFGFGVRNVSSVGNVKADNTYCDVNFTGFPIYQVVDSDGLGVADWQGFISQSAGAGDGLIEAASGAVLCNCGFQFGTTSMSADLTFRDTNPFNIVFRQHLYYGGANRAEERHLVNYEDWYSVEAFGNGASETTVEMGVLVGTGDDRRGVNGTRFSTEELGLQTFSIDFQTDITDIAAVNLYGVEIIGARDGALFDDGNKTTLIDFLAQRSGEVDLGTTNSGSEVFKGTWVDPETRDGVFNYGLKWPGATNNVSDCAFITTGAVASQHMVRMPAAGTFDFDNIKFFGTYTPISNSLRHLATDLSGTLIDENEFSNENGETNFDNGTVEGVSQSFPGANETVRGVSVQLRMVGTVTGSISAKIYAHSGTYGTSSVPTGSPLATSESLALTNLDTTMALVNFPFNDDVAISSGTNYVLTIEGTQTGDGSNYLVVGIDTTTAHGGNAATWDGSTWTATGAADLVFEVAATQIKINALNGSNPDWVQSTGGRADLTTTSAINQVGIVTLNAVTVKVTIQDADLTVVENARVEITANETVGSITTGDVILTGLTDVSGIIQDTGFNYEAAFDPSGLDVVIKSRQGSVTPFLVADERTGIITSSGLDSVIQLNFDE